MPRRFHAARVVSCPRRDFPLLYHKRIIDVYASGDLERNAYVERSLDYDQELNALRRQRAELIKKIPLLHKAEAVDVSITQYCSAANVRFRSCVDFSSKRQFLLDHIDKVVFSNDRVELHGSVPVRVSASEAATDEADDSKIDFCISSDFATFIRTVVIICALAAFLAATDQWQPLGSVSGRSHLFLILSGLATGGSWVCYFRALKIGKAVQVAPIDKLSVVLVAVFGVIVLGERLTLPNWLGVALIALGAILVAYKP